MKALQRDLGQIFGLRARRAPVERKPTVTEKLKTAAVLANCEVVPVKGGGFEIWPRNVDDADDPFAGDHYADDAKVARKMLDTYTKLREKEQKNG